MKIAFELSENDLKYFPHPLTQGTWGRNESYEPGISVGASLALPFWSALPGALLLHALSASLTLFLLSSLSCCSPEVRSSAIRCGSGRAVSKGEAHKPNCCGGLPTG